MWGKGVGAQGNFKNLRGREEAVKGVSLHTANISSSHKSPKYGLSSAPFSPERAHSAVITGTTCGMPHPGSTHPRSTHPMSTRPESTRGPAQHVQVCSATGQGLLNSGCTDENTEAHVGGRFGNQGSAWAGRILLSPRCSLSQPRPVHSSQLLGTEAQPGLPFPGGLFLNSYSCWTGIPQRCPRQLHHFPLTSIKA